MNRHSMPIAAAIALSIVLTACGTSAASTEDAPAATVTTTETIDAVTTTVTVTAATRVSANTATVAEITAALTAAGVGNADRWAREVVEYRPYDTSDPDLTHLRDELAKYNPAAGVVDLIVSVLEP